MGYRTKIAEQSLEASEALKQQKATASEREKQLAAQTAQKTQRKMQLWETNNKEIVEKFPKYFKPDEDDPEGNKMLESGYALANQAFSDGNGIDPDDLVRLHSWAHNRAAAFGRVALQLKRSQSRITELEKELAEYTKAEPTKDTKRPAGAQKKLTFSQQLDEELAEMDK